MALLAVGFSLIVIGDSLLGDVLGLLDHDILEIIEESMEIVGFAVLILAVKRS